MGIGVAIVGCGFVSDLYFSTFANHDPLPFEIRGCFDIDSKRSKMVADAYGCRNYTSYDEILADPQVDVVLNLTSTASHFEISNGALRHGKHVYSEKPLALKLEEAEALVELAHEQDLQLVCAPSSVLGPAAQTLIKAVKDEVCGVPRLIYAEVDDGMIHELGMEHWKTKSGLTWPAREEFQTGCTLEHAGYALSWLVAMFGSAKRVVSTAALLIPERGPETPEAYSTPDFSCACVEFDNGVIARVTNSIVAPHDHRLRVFCTDGHLELDELWNFDAKVYSVPLPKTRFKRQLSKRLGYTGRRALPRVGTTKVSKARQAYNLDFSLGLIDMVTSISQGATPRLAGAFSLHITELSLAIQHPDIYGTEYHPKSVVAPIW